MIAFAAAPVFADSHGEGSDNTEMQTQQATDGQAKTGDAAMKEPRMQAGEMTVRASDLLGEPVFIRPKGAADEEIPDSLAGPGRNWENAGEVDDVILSREGRITSVTLDVGGLLGMGEKNVKTGLDELKFVAESDAEGDFFLVFTGDRSALEERESYDRAAAEEGGELSFVREWAAKQDEQGYTAAEADVAETEDGDERMAEGSGQTAAEQQEAADTQPEEGLDRAEAGRLSPGEREALTAEELEGMIVQGQDGQDIGDIETLLLDDAGKIEKVVIDVGGFLGIGEKPVAVKFDDLQISRDDAGDLTVSSTHSYDEFEKMEEWQG
jgi:hypothetical protein